MSHWKLESQEEVLEARNEPREAREVREEVLETKFTGESLLECEDGPQRYFP